MSLSTEPRIGAVRARAYRIPTDRPEADGTLEWRATTLVLAEIEAGPVTGLGYSYTDASAARLIAGTLGEALHGQGLSDHPAMLAGMWRAVRNLGRAGLAATAISALDIALWDARAKWLDLPLARLLGRARERVEIYGSGGFTSYDLATLSTQLEGWRREGIRACKSKIGARDASDMTRLRTARDALGPEGELFVDANGAYAPRVALGFVEAAAAFDLRWFEEPVSSEDLGALRDRGRRIRLAARRFPPAARIGRDRRAAGRCHALRRHQRLSGRGRAGRGASPRPVGPLRAGPASARGRRAGAGAPYRVVPRSRAHRAAAVRRCAGPARRPGGRR